MDGGYLQDDGNDRVVGLEYVTEHDAVCVTTLSGHVLLCSQSTKQVTAVTVFYVICTSSVYVCAPCIRSRVWVLCIRACVACRGVPTKKLLCLLLVKRAI